MKELSIEEKAKAYDRALEIAKKNFQALEDFGEGSRFAYDGIRNTFIRMFPELAESDNEKDKLIKELGEYKAKYIQKVLEKFLNSMNNKDDERLKKTTISFLKDFANQGYENAVECIDWIEKQAEQKPIWHNEDEEPQRGSLILLIMQSGTPIVAKIIEPNHTFNHGERWAYIDDLLEKQGKNNMGISEATKKKLEDNLNKALEKESPESWNEFLEKQGEQKPAWSEKDEEIHRKCICAMKASACGFPEEEKFVEQVDNWLKNIKDRVQPQPKQEWNEEDKNMLQSILDEYKSMPIEKRNWLKSLKNRIQPQPKQEWSEEDIRKIDELTALCEGRKKLCSPTVPAYKRMDELKEWLKSLKDRYTWKPSDKQMEALKGLLELINQKSMHGRELISLIEQLKKLKG